MHTQLQVLSKERYVEENGMHLLLWYIPANTHFAVYQRFGQKILLVYSGIFSSLANDLHL
jgi:hypothetical protein